MHAKFPDHGDMRTGHSRTGCVEITTTLPLLEHVRDLQRRLQGVQASDMEFDLTTGVAVLERTPQTLRALLAGLPSGWTDGTEGPETWSPYDIVGHLIHGERTDWIPRAQIILAQGPNRRFTPFDRFAQFRESQGKSLADLLDEFARLRAENLVTLAGWRVTEAQLALEGEHPAFGLVTLRQLLATWVAHDLGHIAQTARVMAKQYREAIGPWRVYLPVMDR
jgi:hypothetical protein